MGGAGSSAYVVTYRRAPEAGQHRDLSTLRSKDLSCRFETDSPVHYLLGDTVTDPRSPKQYCVHHIDKRDVVSVLEGRTIWRRSCYKRLPPTYVVHPPATWIT